MIRDVRANMALRVALLLLSSSILIPLLALEIPYGARAHFFPHTLTG